MTFDIETPADLFERVLLPTYQEFLENNASSRHALQGVLVAYHLFDWANDEGFTDDAFARHYPEPGHREMRGCDCWPGVTLAGLFVFSIPCYALDQFRSIHLQGYGKTVQQHGSYRRLGLPLKYLRIASVSTSAILPNFDWLMPFR